MPASPDLPGDASSVARGEPLLEQWQKWGRMWEAPGVFELLNTCESELAAPEGKRRPARFAPRPA